VEIFWTPGDREEVLTKDDIILDFPTLIDLWEVCIKENDRQVKDLVLR
jgi:hypothetical protein